MKTQLCICLNCNTIMVDENPSKQPEFNSPDNVQDMLFIEAEGGGFWACPVCETDEHLLDVNQIEQIEI